MSQLGRIWVSAAALAALVLFLCQTPSTQAASVPAHLVTASLGDGGVCFPQPCISYVHHRLCRKVCCSCEPPVKTTLAVADPCCCKCVVNVPVCLPACCSGEPCVDSRCGLFGRGIVTYSWCCGYTIRVVFDRCGDVTVHSYGS